MSDSQEFDEHQQAGGYGQSREDAGAFITAFCTRYGLNTAVGMSAISDVCEEFAGEIGKRESGKASGDAATGNRSGGMKATVSIIRVLEYLWKNPGRVRLFAVLYAANEPLLDDCIGHRSMAEFARDIQITKEAVRKEVNMAQDHFKWKPRPEQRGQAAREKMRRTRLAQLGKKSG